jgi:WD40 repeat protein
MKTHILYVGLVLAVGILGTLVGSSLLAPAAAAVQSEDDKGGSAAPVPPGPSQDLLSQEIKLRHTLWGPIVTDSPLSEADGYLILSMTKFSLAFTADGKTLVGARNLVDLDKKTWTGEVKLWDVATGKEAASFPTAGGTRWFALTADGKTLAVVPWNKNLVNLWDVSSGKERVFVDDFYGSVAFTPDGKTLAVGGKDAVRLWDVATGKEQAGLKPCGPFCRVTFSADGKLLAAVSDSEVSDYGKEIGEVTLWDVASGQQRDPLPDAGGGFSSVAFTPDGKTLAAGGAGIVLWDVATVQELATLKADQGNVASLAFTADGKTLASAGGPGDSKLLLLRPNSSVRLWDMASGRVKATFKGFRSSPSYMAFAPDGKTLATFCLGEIKLWEVVAGK